MKCIRLHYIDACLRIASTLSESSQGELKYLIQYLAQQKPSFQLSKTSRKISVPSALAVMRPSRAQYSFYVNNQGTIAAS